MAGKPIADYNILFAVPFLFGRERRLSYYHFTVMRRMRQPTDKPSHLYVNPNTRVLRAKALTFFGEK